jgi:DinB family protein
MDPKTIAYQFGLTAGVLERNIGDLSHDESLISPEPGGNCLNWVLGHITRTRNSALGMMTKKHPFPMKDFDAYDDRTGVPFTKDNALSFAELMRRFRTMQEPLVEAIKALPPEALAAPASFSPTRNPNETIGTLMVSLAFHEAYHVGQTGVLRRVAGKPGVIKPPKELAIR